MKGKVKLLFVVQLVLVLANNLMSIRQQMGSGYSFLFKCAACQTIAVVLMTQNNMFPFNVSSVENNVLIDKGVNKTQLWYHHYVYLNNNGVTLVTRRKKLLGYQKWVILIYVKVESSLNKIENNFMMENLGELPIVLSLYMPTYLDQ